MTYKSILYNFKFESWKDIDATNTYWFKNGKYQSEYDEMMREHFEFSKTAISLFHRYYRFYNDGDCPSSMKHSVVSYSKYLEEKVDDRIVKEYNRFKRTR